jgi:hypothetical protein
MRKTDLVHELFITYFFPRAMLVHVVDDNAVYIQTYLPASDIF